MNKWLIFILLFSLSLRLYRLDNLTLFGDEIDVGNQAYSLLTTARDYKGNFLPAYLQSFSESRAPLFIYSAIPSIALFGRNEIGVRLPSVIFGLTSLFGLYLLVNHLTKSLRLALLSTLLMSLTPWHFHYSRSAFEVTLLLSLIIFATYFYLKSRSTLSLVLFTLSFYTYNTANIFVPLLFLFLLISTRPPLKKILPGLIISFVIVGPLAYQIIFGPAGNRFGLVSIFSDSNIVNQIVSQRTSVSIGPPPPIEKVFHNKLLAYPIAMITNYLTSFSPQFLFLSGDPNPRHQVPEFGPLLLIFAPLIIIGLLNYYQKYPLFFFWLLASPIASSLTTHGGQHATRLFIMLPPLIFFVALGLLHLNRKMFFLITLSILLNFSLYYHQYFVHLPKINFSSWNYGHKYLYSTPIPSTSKIYVSNTNFDSLNPFIFYQRISPKFTQSATFTDNQLLGFPLNQNIYFVNNWQTNDPLDLIQKTAKSNDVYFLLQLKDIPGDWDLTTSPLPGFNTLNTVYLPNRQIYGQVIQKL